MTQTSFALMTVLGRAKEAAALANGTAIQITEIAIGDGVTVPSGGETQLYNEVDRFPVSGHGTVAGAANVAYFDAYLSAADGPYTIREAGLYDSQGDLIAIAHYNPAISKPVPSSGQTVEATVRLEVAFSNVASIVIAVDPSMTVPLQRLSRLPWIPVLSMTITAPPASPAVGDAYLVPAGATGAWSGHAGKVAEYTTAGWAILTPTDGHAVSLPDGRTFMRRAGSYSEYVATTSDRGLVKLASKADVIAGRDNEKAITPAALADGIGAYIGGDELTLWVRLDGNNANDGSENTPSKAFATLAGAINFAMGRYGPGGKPIKLQLGQQGTYENASLPAGSSFTIVGDPGNPANYVIVNANGQSNISCVNSYVYVIGLRLRNDISGRHVVDSVVGGVVDLSNVIFQTSPGTTQSCIRAAYGGVVRMVGPIEFAANSTNAVLAVGGSVNSVVGNTLSFYGSPAFSDATMAATNGGAIYLGGTALTGTASGIRYKAATNAVIDTAGSGGNFIPGSAAGTTATGGIYV